MSRAVTRLKPGVRERSYLEFLGTLTMLHIFYEKSFEFRDFSCGLVDRIPRARMIHEITRNGTNRTHYASDARRSLAKG